MEILNVEISPSGRARCSFCSKKIKKFEVRGSFWSNLLCEKCVRDKLRGKIDEIERRFKEFNDLSIEEREAYLKKLKMLKKLR